ncbi:helix-turn-helix domain-containing protein [Magnetococcales bacterium HHB-1]
MMTEERSTGNIFEDLEMDNPEEERAKAQLSIQIRYIIKERGLTQKQAGKILGISQTEVSNLVRGATEQFTMDRMFRFLNLLGRNVRIIVEEKSSLGLSVGTHVEYEPA